MRRTALLLAATVIAGCEIEEVTIPRTEPRVALHGVLSATAVSQVVLIERTRAGIIPTFELGDPFLSQAVAERDAIVTLTTPSGQTLTGVEDDELPGSRGRGQGYYRFPLPGSALERGSTYRLTVMTQTGEVLTAETSVPQGLTDAVREQRVFDRSRDTVVIEWPASAGARSYHVRVETPWGPRAFFTDSTRVRLTGELRNADEQELPRVFIPGFLQPVTISAVDSNYYDWFRSQNDPLSGLGLVSRVEGGIGVFGSLVRLHFEEFRVVAPQPEASAGRFLFDGTPYEASLTPNLELELYVEASAGRAGEADAITGRYVRRPFLGITGCIICGALGTSRAGRIELALLRDWYASDTAEIFTGTVRGDTIVGTYRGLGLQARFVRQR